MREKVLKTESYSKTMITTLKKRQWPIRCWEYDLTGLKVTRPRAIEITYQFNLNKMW